MVPDLTLSVEGTGKRLATFRVEELAVVVEGLSDVIGGQRVWPDRSRGTRTANPDGHLVMPSRNIVATPRG